MRDTSASTQDPAQLITTIRPRTGRASLRLAELWSRRELLYFLVWRDIKVRYKQTALGAAWAILQPIALTVVFTLFLGSLTGIAPSGVPYSLFALSGLVVWTLFAQGLLRASESLVMSANLLTRVYFPRLLLPISSVASPILDFVLGFGVLLVAMLLMGFPPSMSIVWLVPLSALAVLAALAGGLWLSAVNVRYRDVRHAVPFIVQVWFFATPIVYSVSLVPEQLRWVYFVNPMAGVVAGFRWALLGQEAPPVEPILIACVVTALGLVAGLAYFRNVEREFADVI